MAEPLHVVCPHCDATNRVPAERLAEGKCGKCLADASLLARWVDQLA